MSNFKDKFNSFINQAQQKIAEIQNNEKVQELIEQSKEIIKNPQDTQQLLNFGKELISAKKNPQDLLESAKRTADTGNLSMALFILKIIPVGSDVYEEAQQKILEYEEILNQKKIEHEQIKQTKQINQQQSLPEKINDIIDLSSNSASPQNGEYKWTPSSGQDLAYIFLSEIGIRCVTGFVPATKNKLALKFSELILLSFSQKDNELVFNFQLNKNEQDKKVITLGFSCLKQSNYQEIIRFIIQNVNQVSAELEQKRNQFDKEQQSKKSILDYLDKNKQQIIFQQKASYRGGILGYPTSADKPGIAYILNDSIIFYDNFISIRVYYNRIIDAQLDFFELRGSRAILAGGNNARMLQEIKNNIAITYLDQDDNERTFKLQIHGAATIPGEAVKAQEFLNYLLDFKGSFIKKQVDNESNNNTIETLKKLKELKDMGIISESEFEEKKRSLLDKI